MNQINTHNLLEGGLWGGWFTLTFVDLIHSVSARRELNNLPPSSTKADAIWKANKTVVTNGFSAISSLSMVLTWAHELEMLPLGSLFPFVNGFGYMGSALSAFLKGGEVVIEIFETSKSYLTAHSWKMQGQILLVQIHKMLRLAFYVSLVAWSSLGAVYSFIGGAVLFKVMDTFLYYTIITFLTNLAGILTLPKEVTEIPLIPEQHAHP